MQPGLADATTVAPDRSMAATLRARMSPARSGCRRGVRAARAAAQAFVVELDEFARRTGRAQCARAACARCTWRRWHGSCTATARPSAAASTSGGQAVDAGREPLVHVVHARAERDRLVRAEQMPVVLHRRATSGRVDDDRRVARHRRHHRRRHPYRGVRRGRRARRARRSSPRRVHSTAARHRHAGRLDHPLRRRVHVALPRVHHAAGEQPDVGATRPQLSAAAPALLGQPQPPRPAARQQPRPLRDAERRSSRPARAGGARARGSRRAATTVGTSVARARARRACLP